MNSAELLKCVLKVSEKAANIARVCRQNQHLFELLVQEKKSQEKNSRFVQDFKTLADVLIQEMVKHDIGNMVPELAEHIRGEENNTFCNAIGEKITVKVESSETATAKLLTQVLNEDSTAAELLAYEVHREMPIEDVNTKIKMIPTALDFPIAECGVWIDPIDSTAEYISGEEGEIIQNGIYSNGLKCVTVLIGVYNRSSGVPIMGVINQPFYEQINSTWRGKCEWGIDHANTRISSLTDLCPTPSEARTVLVSSSEDATLKSHLIQSGYHLIETPGAGYKLLSIIQGRADVYLLSKGSTFRWDTCSPHAILLSLGGNLISFQESLCKGQDENVTRLSINYENPEVGSVGVDKWCNKGGIIAFRDCHLAEELITLLSSYYN